MRAIALGLAWRGIGFGGAIPRRSSSLANENLTVIFVQIIYFECLLLRDRQYLLGGGNTCQAALRDLQTL